MKRNVLRCKFLTEYEVSKPAFVLQTLIVSCLHVFGQTWQGKSASRPAACRHTHTAVAEGSSSVTTSSLPLVVLSARLEL